MAGEALILGLDARDEACLVCGVKPQAFRATKVENVLECARCGAISTVHQDGAKLVPVSSANPADLEILQSYWADTQRKLGSREIAKGDPEILARCEALDEWCRAHPELVMRSELAKAAPYRSVTAIAVELEDGSGRQAWSIVSPGDGVGLGLVIPLNPNAVVAGTILTLQTPIPLRPQPGRPRLPN